MKISLSRPLTCHHCLVFSFSSCYLQTIAELAFPSLFMTVLPPTGCLTTSKYKTKKKKSQTMQLASSPSGNGCFPYANSAHLSCSQMSTGTSSPQSLKKILSLSEEGNERHRRPEDTVSNASSQLSSPPTSPQSSPKKGKPIILPPSHTILQAPSHCHDVSQMPPGGCQCALHYISVIVFFPPK